MGRYRVMAETKDGEILILEHGILHEHTAMLIAAARGINCDYKRVWTDHV